MKIVEILVWENIMYIRLFKFICNYYFMFIYKFDFNVNINKERVLKKYESGYLKKSGNYLMI